MEANRVGASQPTNLRPPASGALLLSAASGNLLAMGASESTPESIDVLAGLTAECRSRGEYEAARHEWLQRAIGFDTSYVGAASPDTCGAPAVSGISARNVSSCESHIDRYWGDLLALNSAALRAGGTVHDQDVFSLRTRERMPFYREVVGKLGIRATAASVLRAQGKTLGCLYLGRTSRGARFDAELSLLRRALPVLSLGRRLFELAPEPSRAPTTDTSDEIGADFTRREQQVLALLARGLSNRQIATQLGTSPFTVKNQVAALLSKADVRNRAALVYATLRSRPV